MRAIESCEITGYDPDNHFRGVTKMVKLGSGMERQIEDFMLKDNLYGELTITKEHIQNNQSVREMLG